MAGQGRKPQSPRLPPNKMQRASQRAHQNQSREEPQDPRHTPTSTPSSAAQQQQARLVLPLLSAALQHLAIPKCAYIPWWTNYVCTERAGQTLCRKGASQDWRADKDNGNGKDRHQANDCADRYRPLSPPRRPLASHCASSNVCNRVGSDNVDRYTWHLGLRMQQRGAAWLAA